MGGSVGGVGVGVRVGAGAGIGEGEDGAQAAEEGAGVSRACLGGVELGCCVFAAAKLLWAYTWDT